MNSYIRIVATQCSLGTWFVSNTFENDIKELDPRKAYKYLGIEENFDIQHKNEKEKLKKEY